MVGHDVGNAAHAGRSQRSDQRLVVFIAAQLRIERVVIDDCIAVRAAAACLAVGRSVEMAHAQIVQIGHDLGGVAIGHRLAAELQSVGRFRRRGPIGKLALEGFHDALHPGGLLDHICILELAKTVDVASSRILQAARCRFYMM